MTIRKLRDANEFFEKNAWNIERKKNTILAAK